MTLRELLLGGPGLSGYAYNADVYCVECGQGIIREVYPNIKGDEDAQRDSNHCPQPIFFGESDHPQHCGHCGEYLYGEVAEESATFERFTITMPREAVDECSHPGDCGPDVEAWAPQINRPAECTPDALRAELDEYGAWDETELADDAANWERIVWIAAGNIKEERGR